MHNYELVVVLSPMISPDEASRAWERIKGFITTREADIVHEERWGTRRLAYPVKKGQYQFLEGNYHLTRFTTEGSFNRELENFLKLDENVLRSLVTTTLSEEELAAHAAQTRAPRPPRAPAGMPPAGGPQGAPQVASGDQPATDAAGSTPEAPAAATAATEAPPAAESAPSPEAPAATAEAPSSEASTSDATPAPESTPSSEAPAATAEGPSSDAPAAAAEAPSSEAPAAAEEPSSSEAPAAAEEPSSAAEAVPPAEDPKPEEPSE